MARGAVFSGDTAGSWFQNRRFRSRKVGGGYRRTTLPTNKCWTEWDIGLVKRGEAFTEKKGDYMIHDNHLPRGRRPVADADKPTCWELGCVRLCFLFLCQALVHESGLELGVYIGLVL